MLILTMSDQGNFMTSRNISAYEYIDITLASQLYLFNELVKSVPEEEQAQFKEALFNLYNEAASGFLKSFAPEYELRPDLTEEAILAMENQILEEKAKAMEVPTPAYMCDPDSNLIPLNSLDKDGKPIAPRRKKK